MNGIQRKAAQWPVPPNGQQLTGREKECCDVADRIPSAMPNRMSIRLGMSEVTVSRPTLILRVDQATARRSVTMHPNQQPLGAASPAAAFYPSPGDSGDFWIPRPGTWYFNNAGAAAYDVFVLDMPDCCMAQTYIEGGIVAVGSLTLGYVHKVFADSPYSYGVDDFTVEWDATGGASVLNLPAIAAGNLGRVLVVKLDPVDVSGNGVSVTPAGGDTIDGVAGAMVLNIAGDSVMLQSDGVSNWVIL